MPLGPDERIVFEKHATPLYEEIVTAGGIDASDARIAAGRELQPRSSCWSRWGSWSGATTA